MHASADPDHLYDKVIMPYKGRLEEWFVSNQSTSAYLKCIWLTALVVLSPRSQAIWHLFTDLPIPPPELAAGVNWPGENDSRA